MQVIKCGLIMITKPSKKHWYFFLFILGSFLRVFIPELPNIIKKILKIYKPVIIDKETKKEEDYKKYLVTLKYFEMIRTISSDLLIGIFHCIHKIRNRDDFSKTPQQTYNRNSQKIYFIFNDETSRVPTKYKIIFIISIIDIICQLLIPIKYIIEGLAMEETIKNKDTYYLFSLLWFDIFARYFFSRWILKTYFYIHHYFSFFLNCIGLALITIVDIFTKKKKYHEEYDIIYISFASLQVILYSFEDIMNKVAFRTLYILPNTLIFYKGLVQLFYFLIISGLFFGFKLYCFEYGDFKITVKSELQNFITFVPFNIMRTIFLVKVIDSFSAQHMALLKISEIAVLFIYTSIADNILDKEQYFDGKNWVFIFPQAIGFLFLLISSLIHNEIIIINHTKLKAKTEYYLDKDADKEQNSSFYSDTLFTDSKDSSNSVTNLYSDLTGSDLS